MLIEPARAGFESSKRIAAENGGRLPTSREFIRALKDPEFYKQASGNLFWLNDEPGLKVSGPCKVDYDKGELVPVSEEERNNLPAEQRGWAYEGNGP